MDFQGIGKIPQSSAELFWPFSVCCWPFGSGFFLGKLPGDIFVHKGNLQLFLPMATSIIVSIVLTIILNLIISLFR
jgi:hypothetical protein